MRPAARAMRPVVAATTPLAPDETYYWVWSHALAPGYVDHPPMVAWLIGFGHLFGLGAGFVRLPFVLCEAII